MAAAQHPTGLPVPRSLEKTLNPNKAHCIVVHNIMAPHEAQSCEVEPGTLINDLDPRGRFPAVCRLDGQWILRKDWGFPILPGQVVEFYVYPQGGGGDGGSDVGRAVLMIAALYIAVQFGQPWLYQAAGGVGGAAGTAGALSWAASGAIAQFAAVAIVNALVPADTGNNAVATNNTSQSATYSTNVSGNQARLGQAIPVLYGRNKTYPDFAAEPYTLYENDDQFYHALFCIGQGEYDIDPARDLYIDDTNLANFAEVERAILPPGAHPTIVTRRYTTAAEVTGNEVQEGRITGPFVGSRPQTKCTSIGIDVAFSRGLATYDSSGNPGNKSVSWRVEVRSVDDFGSGITPWSILATETVTKAQTKPLRLTYNYDLPVPIRPQVRLVRTTPFDDNSRVANTLEWVALRCEIEAPFTLCPTATHLEIKMRATQQLSGLTQRRIAVISRRKLRIWNGTTWSAPTVTRNPAWALADKWTSLAYGDKYPEDRCDLDSLLLYAAKWGARQDRFDGVFDTTYESFQADQMIAQSGRAAVFRRGGVMTLTRDESKSMPVTAYTARNIDPGSMSIEYSFPNESTPDGVIVEFWHNRSWDWQEIVCPAPGVTTPVRAQRVKLFGVTGPTHARREGLYQAANSYYRRRFASFTTELEGMLPAFGSAVVFSPNLRGWGRSGDVVSYNESTREMRLTEPVEWTPGAQHYISVMDRTGNLVTPVLVSPGSDAYRVVLATALSFTPSTDKADEERTKYIFGTGRAYETIMRVLSIRNTADNSGRKTFSISGVIEDERVHTVDAALLPTGDVVWDPTFPGPPPPGLDENGVAIQDPVDLPVDDGGGSGEILVPYLADITLNDVQFAEIFLRNDGRGYYDSYTQNPDDGVRPLRLVGQWLLGAPKPTTDADNYEVYVTQIGGSGTVESGSSPLDTWLSLGSDWTWRVFAGTDVPYFTVLLRATIRETLSGVVQTSAVWSLTVNGFASGGDTPP